MGSLCLNASGSAQTVECCQQAMACGCETVVAGFPACQFPLNTGGTALVNIEFKAHYTAQRSCGGFPEGIIAEVNAEYTGQIPIVLTGTPCGLNTTVSIPASQVIGVPNRLSPNNCPGGLYAQQSGLDVRVLYIPNPGPSHSSTLLFVMVTLWFGDAPTDRFISLNHSAQVTWNQGNQTRFSSASWATGIATAIQGYVPTFNFCASAFQTNELQFVIQGNRFTLTGQNHLNVSIPGVTPCPNSPVAPSIVESLGFIVPDRSLMVAGGCAGCPNDGGFDVVPA